MYKEDSKRSQPLAEGEKNLSLNKKKKKKNLSKLNHIQYFKYINS